MTALITGASSGFGLLTTVTLAKRGWRVIATMRDLARRERLETAAREAGVLDRIEFLALDVTDNDQVQATFAKIGVDANIIVTEFNGIDNLRRIPAAELNVVLSPWNGHRAAQAFERKFGTPWQSHPRLPVGPKQTTSLIREVAQALSLDKTLVDRVIAEEERHAYRFAEYFGDGLILGLPHAYFAVVADSPTAVGITQYLANEIAYIPDIVILADDPPESARPAIVRELTEGVDVVNKPEVVFESDSYRIRQKLKNRNFLFLLASSLEKVTAGEEYGAMHHSIAFPSYDRLVLDRNYAGYRGGLALVEDLTSKWVGPL